MVWIGTISVKVLSADGLKPCDKNGKSDPYVALSVHPRLALMHNDKDKTLKKLKTSTKKKTLSPVFHETIGPFEVNGAEALEFVVKDWNFMSRADVCGSVCLPLDKLELRSGIVKRVDVELKDQGRLSLEVEFVDGQVLFGLDVTSVVTREGGKVPTIIQRCVAFVETMGVDEPGLYRKPGRLTDVRALKDLFIADGKAKIPESIVDVDTVASLLKLYLREMPEPLFTNALHTELIDAAKSATTDDYAALVRVLRKLPEAHLDTINYLFRHLRTVVSASALNKMTAENLATCFGPSLVTPSNSDQTVDALMVSVGKDNQAIERLISLPAVLEEALAAQGGAAPDRQDARRIHRARSSLQYIPVETEYRKVIGALHSPITTFSQFRELCYELGCRASDVDYADAVSGCVGGALLDYRRFHAWVNRSRLVHFVNRTPQKRLGIIQAITYFQFFDKDNDGTIDATEWPELHSDLRKHYVLSDDPAECLAELDADGDGVVGLEEYLAWCLQPVPDVSHRLNSKGNPPPATQPRLGKAKSTPSTSNRPQAEPEFYDRS